LVIFGTTQGNKSGVLISPAGNFTSIPLIHQRPRYQREAEFTTEQVELLLCRIEAHLFKDLKEWYSFTKKTGYPYRSIAKGVYYQVRFPLTTERFPFRETPYAVFVQDGFHEDGMVFSSGTGRRGSRSRSWR
jgi:hypothetical protein